MKKISFISFIILFFSVIIFSKDYRKYKNINYSDVKKILDNSSDSDIQTYFKTIIGKKIEWEGHVLSKESLDASGDIIYVDLDRTTGNIKQDKPDLFFKIDKKFTDRVEQYQKIYFIAVLVDITERDKRYLITVSDVFLKGLMK